jgi:pimeloyl-ACP methyl ester carboxylesterase
MKRSEVTLAVLGVLLVAAGRFLIALGGLPTQNFVIDEGGCHTPVTLLHPPYTGEHAPAQAVVLHGLAANRRIMQGIGTGFAASNMLVYLLDLPGHGDNTDSFSFARAEQCTTVALASMAREGQINPDSTILVGHSMGGAIAVRMADRFPVAATIVISPAPMVLPRRLPSNLLVLSAQFDMQTLKQAALALQQAAGGDRRQPADFAERRAFWLEHVRHATHTSLLWNRGVNAGMVLWARNALPNNVVYEEPRPGTLLGAAAGLIGLLLLFPLAATSITKLLRSRDVGTTSAPIPPLAALLQWSVAAFFSVGVMKWVVPLRTLHLLTGDYLASLLLLAGILLLAFRWTMAKAELRFEPRAIWAAVILGFAVMLACGAWLDLRLTDAWLNSPRWWRFAAVLLVCWPYCYAEEVALGQPRGHGIGRYTLYLLLRLVLWLACILALFGFGSGQILVFLLVVYMAAWSIFARLGTDGIRKRTGSATAAATFDAILTAWFIAAVFPLT